MALLAYRLKWACLHKAWKVQKTSKIDVQTNSFLTSQGERTVGPRLALQLSVNQACWTYCKPFMCFYYLRVLESRFRNVTSRPELVPSVTAKGERGKKPQTRDGRGTHLLGLR